MSDSKPPTAMRYRKAQPVRISPSESHRQGEITRLAFVTLGRDRVIAFLNADHAKLGGRPLDLAVASDEGCAGVEAELARIGARRKVP